MQQNKDVLLEYLNNIEQGSFEDSVYGCIFGQMIGDSLGSYLEFKQNVTDKELDQSLTMPGGGPFRLQAGQITDDTELAIGLIKGLNQMDPQQYDVENIAKQYFDWVQTDPFDIGNTTSNALSYSLSNGSLMRSSPFAVYAAAHNLDFQTLQVQLKQEVELTHSNPDAQNAALIWVYAIQQIILHHSENEQKIKKVLELVDKQVQNIDNQRVKIFWDDVQKNQIPPFNQSIGFLGIAWIAGFVSINNNFSFKEVMKYVLKQGGDTDTNGCIIGAMHGAKLGFKKILSENKNWIDIIMQCNPQNRMEYKPIILVEETKKLLEKSQIQSQKLTINPTIKNNMNEQVYEQQKCICSLY